MPDLDTLFRAVTTEWEPGKVIADRAGIDRRGAGQKLTSLVRAGVIESRTRQSRVLSERVALYRRVDSEAVPPVVTVVLWAGEQARHADEVLDWVVDMSMEKVMDLADVRVTARDGRWFVVADAVRYQP